MLKKNNLQVLKSDFFIKFGVKYERMIRIHIQQLKILKIHADPDPQPWFPHTPKLFFYFTLKKVPTVYTVSVKNLSKKYFNFNLGHVVRLFI